MIARLQAKNFSGESSLFKATLFLFWEGYLSNIGGTATLIGDPPNIIIAQTGLSFMDFIMDNRSSYLAF